jgi:hypothetical protein
VCNNLNTATQTINVSAAVFVANNDSGIEINGYVGGTSFTNVLVNDTLDGNPITSSQVTTTFVSSTHPGVTLRYSGIEVERGSLENVSLLWDENDDTWNLKEGAGYNTSKLRLKEILTNADTDSGDLTLIGTGTGVVKVAGTTAYESQVTDDDDVPNKKYVDDTIQNNPTFQVVSDNSRVTVSDKERSPNIAAQPGSLAYLTATTGFSTGGESAVSVIVDAALNTQFYPNRTEMFSLEFTGSEITTKSGITNQNILVRTQGTGKLQTNYAVQIDSIAGTPAYVTDATILYSTTPSIGTTGVWYVNPSAEARLQSGELINKNKALVFSMIF